MLRAKRWELAWCQQSLDEFSDGDESPLGGECSARPFASHVPKNRTSVRESSAFPSTSRIALAILVKRHPF